MIWIIFRKELLDTLRDRRTLGMMILIPLTLVPIMIALITQLQASIIRSAENPLIRVGLVAQGNASGFLQLLRDQPDIVVEDQMPLSGIAPFIRRDSLEAGFIVEADFDARLRRSGLGTITLVYESDINTEVIRGRLRELVDQYRSQLLAERMEALGLNPAIADTIVLEERDVARRQLILGQVFGGILPYFFIIFSYLGAMYPAIDLAAGEKERATMETLLTTPTHRTQIVLGKFGVVVLTGVASAMISIVGLYLGIWLVPSMPPELLRALFNILQLGKMGLITLLLVPLAMFFAGLMLTLSLFARSFKEAQSILSPLAIITVLPAIIGLLPGLQLTATTAIVPMLNVSLAMKEIIAGTANPLNLLLVFLSLILLATLSLAVSAYSFQREAVIFRT